MLGFKGGQDYWEKRWHFHPWCKNFFGYGGWFHLSWSFLTHYGWKEIKRKCAELSSAYWRGAQANSYSLFAKDKTMKTLILIVAILLCLIGLARANEPNLVLPEPVQGIVVWGLSEADANSTLETRIGWETKTRFEPGIALKWLTGDPPWGPQPDVISAYMLYHVDEIALVTDATPDNAWEQLLHSLKARPYGGLEIAIPTEGEHRRARTNFIAGTLFSNDASFQWAFAVEYITGDGLGSNDNQALRIGARLRF